MNRREYLRARQGFNPEVGEIYENEGGGRFECLRAINDGVAIMRNIASGWTFWALGLGVYPDGRIDWDYSKYGSFAGR